MNKETYTIRMEILPLEFRQIVLKDFSSLREVFPLLAAKIEMNQRPPYNSINI